ncbi:MAG: ABC transporter substrate-binding protein [Alphaproteobacteria bacterium]
MLRRGVAFGAGLAGVGLASGVVRSRPARAAAGKVIVRTPGGAYEDALRKGVFEPFTAETGIEVVPFATNTAKLIAMVESGSVQVDVADLGEFTAITLANRGALEHIDTAKFTRTNLADVGPVKDYYIGENTYGTVMGYSKESFAGKHPENWADFWNVGTFPGARMLEDMGAEYPNLEFALLADGVPMDKLYPIDVARAFKKLREIRPHITKWWDTGAVSAQMLAAKQVVLGSVWSGRIIPLVEANAPVAIEWNQAARQLQTLCILKGAPNLASTHQYIDFAMQPKPQAEVARLSGYGPVSRKAFDFIDAASAAKLPTSPEHLKISYATDTAWWVEHRAEVADKWQAFLLGE